MARFTLGRKYTGVFYNVWFNRLGGYTRVSYYMDWIVEKMMEASKRKNVTICAGSFGKYWQGSARNSLIENLL